MMNSTSKVSARGRANFWRKHVSEWRQSGESRSSYCREHGIKPTSLSYWCDKYPEKLAKKKQTTEGKRRLRLVPIKALPEMTPSNPSMKIEIRFPDCVVSVDGRIDEDNLKTVLRVLRCN